MTTETTETRTPKTVAQTRALDTCQRYRPRRRPFPTGSRAATGTRTVTRTASRIPPRISNKTVPELRRALKQMGVPFRSRDRKADLARKLNSALGGGNSRQLRTRDRAASRG
tara:strand:+ start:884 stop:1219 length:336 start_codon:yes stop_codon:yes gene_type:complete